jgi:hypothetical protein
VSLQGHSRPPQVSGFLNFFLYLDLNKIQNDRIPVLITPAFREKPRYRYRYTGTEHNIVKSGFTISLKLGENFMHTDTGIINPMSNFVILNILFLN